MAKYTDMVQSLMTPGQKLLMRRAAQKTGLTEGSFVRQAILMHIAFIARMHAGAPEDPQRVQDYETIRNGDEET